VNAELAASVGAYATLAAAVAVAAGWRRHRLRRAQRAAEAAAWCAAEPAWQELLAATRARRGS
jgi:hypothetical protein